VNVQATKAWRSVTIIAQYVDPVLRIPIRATREVWVAPGPAHHILIEDLTNDTGGINLNKDNARTTPIIMTLNELVGKADAVIRDAYGNFVSLGNGVNWIIGDPSKAVVTPAPSKGWIGEIRRPGALSVIMDSTTVTASQTGLTSGSARVHIYYQMPCAMPVADPRGGTYYGSVSVTLSTETPGSTIYYCLNCDSVVPGNSAILYSGPITILRVAMATLKAITTTSQPGYVNSPTMVEVYTNGDSLPASSPITRNFLSPGLHVFPTGSQITIIPAGMNLNHSTITIADLSGRQVKTFTDCKADIPIQWNYESQSGAKIAKGLYVIQIRAQKSIMQERILVRE
jgi:hypothetical protein